MNEVSGPSVITIGNFDGVHLGHRFLIEKTVTHARKLGLPSIVVSFSPHPSHFFKIPDFEPLLLEEKKVKLIESLGVDVLALQEFNQSFSMVTKEDFLRHFLLNPLRPSSLHLGYDFQYGLNGGGDFLFAKDFFSSKNIEVIKEEAFLHEGEVVSSSAIRRMLKSGDINEANALLSYSYCIEGVVEKGKALGRTIGFPTANISLVKTLIPGVGVYVGWAYLGRHRYQAVVNVGTRPTVSDEGRQTIECHMLDFSDSIYGEVLGFEFLGRLRSEKKFSNMQSLKKQLQIDVDQAHVFFEKKY